MISESPALDEVCLVLICPIRKVGACSKTSILYLNREISFQTLWLNLYRDRNVSNLPRFQSCFFSQPFFKTGWIESHENTWDLQMCKLDNCLFPFYCFSQRRRMSGNPKHKGSMKNFRVNPAYPSGLGSFSSKTDNALTSFCDDLILFKWISTQRGCREDPTFRRCVDKTVFDKHGFFSGKSSQAQNYIIQSLRSCCFEMFVLNVCISVSFLRVLKTFSYTSSGISYLESIEEKASWRLHECKVCKYSFSWIKKRGFSLSGATSSPGRFSLALEVGRPTQAKQANPRCRPHSGVSISVSSEETTPILAAIAINFCFGRRENNLDASFYNWLV